MENTPTSSIENREPYTFARHAEMVRRIREGNITADELKAAFESLLASEQSIKAELIAKTLKELAPNGTGGLKKGEVEDRIFSNMLSRFSPGQSITWSPMQETYQDAIRRHVEQVTDETIQTAAAKVRQRIEENQKALTNPETLEDFSRFVAAKGEQALSSEQAGPLG